MKLACAGSTLQVSDVPELTAANAPEFRAHVCAAFAPDFRSIDIDLSRTRSLDCVGLGALVALRNALHRPTGSGELCLLNPSPAVRRVLDLTSSGPLFSIQEHGQTR